jgi:carbonic anhydrase/acetyltransferase-like protein (isoleucine patch superfamily)
VFARGDVKIGRGSEMSGPAWIDNGTSLGENVQIKSGTILKENSRLMSGTSFETGVAFENTVFGRNCTIKSTIIGERAVVGNNVSMDRAMIGQGCNIGNDAKILPGSKLWPNTRVEDGSTIDGIVAVPRDKSFYFDTGLGQYSGILATSIQEFLDALKIVPLESLEYHIGRRDFEKWTKDVLGSIQLADNIRTVRRSQLMGEDLRLQLVDVVKEWADRVSSPESQSQDQRKADPPLTTA